jgi:hypothetical protein
MHNAMALRDLKTIVRVHLPFDINQLFLIIQMVDY